jgi:hypothetical protein
VKDLRKHQIVDKVKELWNANHSLDAGELLFERIPITHWAAWGASILEFIRKLMPPSAEIDAVIELALRQDRWNPENQAEWRAAHKIVDDVNDLHYVLNEPLSKSVFTLAKDVAKIVYNSRGYPAWFDYDAGWAIADDMKQIAVLLNDTEFSTKALLVLCNEKFIDPDENRPPLPYGRQ